MWKEYGAGARNNPRWIPSEIRRALAFMGENDRRHKILEIVTVKAFTDAGGVVEQDLFSNQVRIENPEILETLYSDHIGVSAERYASAQGFKNWQLSLNEDPKGSVAVYAPYIGLSNEDQAREDELAEKEELSGEEEAELAALYKKSNARKWPEDHKGLVTMKLSENGGEMSCNTGFIPKDRLEEAYEAGILDRPSKSSAAGAADDAEVEGDGYSAAVIADLKNLPIDIARDQITDKPELAMTILAWALRCGAWKKPLSISFDHTTRSDLIDEDSAIKGWETEEADYEISLEESEKLGKASRNRVIAGLVATTLYDRAMDHVKPHLAIDVRSVWTPDQTFLARLKKPALVAIAEDLGAADIKVDKMKKGELVEALAGIFAEPPKAIATKVNTWLPPVLRPAKPAEEPEEEAAAA